VLGTPKGISTSLLPLKESTMCRPGFGGLPMKTGIASGHAEGKGFDPHQITALYTERQPCGDCASELAGALKAGTPVTWAVPFYPGIESAAKQLLASYVKRAGGGRSAPSLTGQQQEGK
jgi:hypothetical protein